MEMFRNRDAPWKQRHAGLEDSRNRISDAIFRTDRPGTQGVQMSWLSVQKPSMFAVGLLLLAMALSSGCSEDAGSQFMEIQPQIQPVASIDRLSLSGGQWRAD